jgi:hypothetical protein
LGYRAKEILATYLLDLRQVYRRIDINVYRMSTGREVVNRWFLRQIQLQHRLSPAIPRGVTDGGEGVIADLTMDPQ